MPDTVDLGHAPPDQEALSGTQLYKALGTAAGTAATTATAAVESAQKAGYEYGSMGLRGTWMQSYGNMTAMVVLAVGASAAFLWLRTDSKDAMMEYRQQVIRQEQLSAEMRREDRADQKAREITFEKTLSDQRAVFEKSLEAISRNSQESATQMRMATDQMKVATDSMIRLEKAISAKNPIP